MSKLALGLIVAGVAAMPFVDRTEPVEKVVLSYGTHTPTGTSASKQLVYLVTSNAGVSCRLSSDIDDVSQLPVQADSNCGEVYPGLERASYWVKGDRGNDVLTDANGKTILVTGPSDGFAFEAAADDGAMISFALAQI